MPTSSNNASAGQGNSKTSSNNVSAAATTVASAVATGLRSLGDLNGGSYTFTDTAGVALSSYSYNSTNDIHTFNTNTIGVANETYSLISGANFTSPKWRTPLTYADGTPVLVGDAFSLDVRFDNVSVGAARQYLVAVAVIESGSSTVIGTMKPSGVYGLTSSVGTPGVGIVADNLGAVATVASMVAGYGTTIFSGGATGACVKGGGSCVVRSATTVSSNTRADGNIWASTAATQLQLGVFLSTNGTVTTTGGAFSMGIKFNVVKLS